MIQGSRAGVGIIVGSFIVIGRLSLSASCSKGSPTCDTSPTRLNGTSQENSTQLIAHLDEARTKLADRKIISKYLAANQRIGGTENANLQKRELQHVRECYQAAYQRKAYAREELMPERSLSTSNRRGTLNYLLKGSAIEDRWQGRHSRPYD